MQFSDEVPVVKKKRISSLLTKLTKKEPNVTNLSPDEIVQKPKRTSKVKAMLSEQKDNALQALGNVQPVKRSSNKSTGNVVITEDETRTPMDVPTVATEDKPTLKTKPARTYRGISNSTNVDQPESSFASIAPVDIDINNKIPETQAEFDSLEVSANTKKAISLVMKYKYMTPVQEQSIPIILEGRDVFVKARTGTGKTLGFLIPAIELLISEKRRYAKAVRSGMGAPVSPMILVLSPTRELTLQIADEAKALCKFHELNVLTLVGGTNVDSDKRAIGRPTGIDILVATPGRLLMHLQETRGFAQRLSAVKVLVYDEADRLLDMGFKRDIERINTFLPKNKLSNSAQDIQDGSTITLRQTLLFSATFNDEVRSLLSMILKPGYKLIDTVGEQAEQVFDSTKYVPHSTKNASKVPNYFILNYIVFKSRIALVPCI